MCIAAEHKIRLDENGRFEAIEITFTHNKRGGSFKNETKTYTNFQDAKCELCETEYHNDDVDVNLIIEKLRADVQKYNPLDYTACVPAC